MLARPVAEYDLNEGLVGGKLNVQDETAVSRGEFSSPEDVYAWGVGVPLKPASRAQIGSLEQGLNEGLVSRAKRSDSVLVLCSSEGPAAPLNVGLLRCSHDNPLFS